MLSTLSRFQRALTPETVARHHQMISFQKIYGLYGLKHHTMEINGDVTMKTNKQTNKQQESENRASQQIDKGRLDC